MRRRTLFSTLALAFVSACATDIPNPTSSATSFAPVDAVQADSRAGRRGKKSWQQQVRLNRGKYRNHGHKPRTGTNGNVTIESRALLQANGNTTLELSTGSIEDGTSIGVITKVQVKVIGTNGKVARTLNYNSLADNNGYVTIVIPGLAVGQKLELIAVVAGVAKGRVVVKAETETVTLTTDIDLGPDVNVASISLPATARPGMPVLISAVVRELNGDNGATANCVLSENGTVLDTAPSIWVDAGGTVTCLFLHSFTTEGVHQITIAATNVSPGDWNPANNSVTANITIARPPVTHLDIPTGTLDVLESQFVSNFSESRPAPYLYSHTSNQSAAYTKITLNAFDNAAYRAGPWDRVAVTVRANSAAKHSATLAIQYTQEYLDGDLAYNCAYYNSFGEWAQVCGTTGPGVVQTYYFYQYQAGTVTYYGSEMICNPGDVCDETAGFSWNNTETYNNPVALGFSGGDVVTLDISFFDAFGDDYFASRSATLTTVPLDQDFHRCVFDGLGDFCTDLVQTGYQLVASLSW